MHEIVKGGLKDGDSMSWEQTMLQSFSKMDKEVGDCCDGGAGAFSSNCRCELQTPQCDAVGSTAVVAIVTPDKIVVSNCGNSRAVLCRNGVVIPLSVDYKPDRPDELNRIQEAGGRVVFWDGPRVLGVLTMSRAIDAAVVVEEELAEEGKIVCTYILFQKMLKQLSGPILILGSRILNPDDDFREVDEKLSSVFSYNIELRPPEDENHLISWKSQLEEDMKMIQFKDNKNHIIEVLSANDIHCEDLDSICLADTIVLSNYIEEIVVSAISSHLMNIKEPDYKNGKLIISSKSLSHGLSIFQEGKSIVMNTLKVEAQAEKPKATRAERKAETAVPESKNDDPPAPKVPEIPPDNEFEKSIRPEVIPASEIGVTFAYIGVFADIGVFSV